ncbi:hypothetical protein GCM10018793_43230 [Streptomyces sulfonofaciens]|uniref:Uncharacterized protein n=1 Tax=Streptomyces sulfonofaciens TaxID=68272 RepID=A0A919GF27_9ACTN|nr:hypothetical protein GCM10018793_43230 [Streptomyces sulfonofaciens]
MVTDIYRSTGARPACVPPGSPLERRAGGLAPGHRVRRDPLRPDKIAAGLPAGREVIGEQGQSDGSRLFRPVVRDRYGDEPARRAGVAVCLVQGLGFAFTLVAPVYSRVTASGYATVSALWNAAYDAGMGIGAGRLRRGCRLDRLPLGVRPDRAPAARGPRPGPGGTDGGAHTTCDGRGGPGTRSGCCSDGEGSPGR